MINPESNFSAEPITQGPKHHFFGYLRFVQLYAVPAHR